MDLKQLVQAALKEDLPAGDLTTDSLDLKDKDGRARLLAKDDLVVSGRELFESVFKEVDGSVSCSWQFKDGDFVWKGQTLALLSGPLSSLLKGERVALNFICHLSGIASLTRCFVKQVEHTRCKILDTRKTTPLLREVEKTAVRHGLGHNHRLNLSSAVLIKDNHLQAVGGVRRAVQQVRRHTQSPIEVECTTLEQVREAVDTQVRRILLDNMTNEQIHAARKIIPASIEVEASGGMKLERVRSVAELGVDYISVGALTHSAPSADMSLEFE